MDFIMILFTLQLIQGLEKIFKTKHSNWLYAQLRYFLNFSQLLVSCLPLLDKLD